MVATTVAVVLLAASGAVAAVTDELATNVNQVLVPGGYSFDEFLRSNGVYLLPRQHVAIATVDERPAPATGRRIQIVFVELDAGDPNYGKVIETYPLAYTAGSTAMRGLSATSFVDSDGSVDGLLIATDVSPARVLATTINGFSGVGGILGTATVAGISSVDLIPSAIPAVESGTFDGETRVLMAHASPGSVIRVGFLVRTGPTWRFQETSQISTFDPSQFDCGPPSYEIAAAYDPTRQEFTVAWECGAFAAYARRFDWDGDPVGPVFLAHTGPEALHSGATLSYNRVSDRYFFSFQHNSAVLTPDGAGSFTCTVDPAVGCQTVVPCTVHGAHWAAEVDYASCFEFRSGGTHLSAPNPGQNYQLVSGRDGNVCSEGGVPPYDWVLESQIFPSRPTGAVHEYVRCPSNDVTVVIHSRSDPNNIIGDLRYSFIDEPRAFAFDDSVFTTITARYGLLGVLRQDGDFFDALYLGSFTDPIQIPPAMQQLPDPPEGDGYWHLWRRLGESFGNSSLDPDPRDELDLSLPVGGGCQADLLIHRFELSGGCVLEHGEELGGRVLADVANVGSTTSGSTFAGFYLSTDPTITTSDRLLIGGRDSIPPLTPEVVFSLPGTMEVPADWPVGPAYLGLLVDEFNAVSECDETNNTKAIPVTVE